MENGKLFRHHILGSFKGPRFTPSRHVGNTKMTITNLQKQQNRQNTRVLTDQVFSACFSLSTVKVNLVILWSKIITHLILLLIIL